jgi:phospholipase D1/2
MVHPEAHIRQHTKSVLESLHPNIHVFRHPEHTPSSDDFKAELGDRIGHLTNLDLAKASEDVVSSFYGTAKDVTLFWAHHEKLLVVDECLAFMGGLDLCKQILVLAVLI